MTNAIVSACCADFRRLLVANNHKYLTDMCVGDLEMVAMAHRFHRKAFTNSDNSRPVHQRREILLAVV